MTTAMVADDDLFKVQFLQHDNTFKKTNVAVAYKFPTKNYSSN
jgi:hypothetical protein